MSPELAALFLDIELASVNIIHLKGDETKRLQKLLDIDRSAFGSNGKPTTQIKHRIDYGNNIPIAVSLYRLFPQKTNSESRNVKDAER